ncbi:MAG: acetylserotonin O-methyltransferase [Thermoguttaceae bacterium]|jgi:SAM-dependent methyltransferase|nr:acetylserotonin O-methyltransferase [Thermoguttaceae bacterium]
MGILRRLFAWIVGRARPDEPPEEPIFWTLSAVYLARAYYVAAELGIADLLESGPRSCAELAAATGAHERSLFRVLRTLAGFGVFAMDEEGKFRLTPRAELLRSDAPGSVRYWTMVVGHPALWQGLALALDAVKTGKTGFELAHGMPYYEYCRQHPEYAETFIRGMSAWSDWQAHVIVRAYDFGRYGKVVDVGGGNGSLMMAILEQNPAVHGVLVDQPGTIAHARPRIEARSLDRRCELVPGNILDAVPEGGDAYVIKHVLHDWDDDGACRILRACHRAMPPHARLVIVEGVLDPANSKDRLAKMLDIEHLLVMGAVRTRDEFEALFRQTGFCWLAAHRTSIPDGTIIEAVKC